MTTFTVKKHTFHSAAGTTGNGTALTVAGLSTLGIQIEGITTATLTFQGTIDGSTWYSVQAMNVADGSVATTATADGLFVVSVAGLDQFRVALAWTAGSVTVTGRAVSGGSLNFADVDVAGSETVTLAAGEAHIGQVGSTGTTISQTPTITAGAYSAGDAVGGLLTFANAGRVSGGGGVIKTVTIIDDAGQDAELELWLFDRTFTAMSDNAAWAPSEADLENHIGVISTEDSSQGWLAAGTPSTITIDVATGFDLNGTSLFGQLVTRGTPTYAATDDLTIKVKVMQD